MKQHPKTRMIAIVLLTVFFAALCLFMAGARINTTKSLPRGLYWTVGKLPERGDIVMFAPIDNAIFREARKRGYITFGTQNGFCMMFKKLVGLPGDIISVVDGGVIANGVLLPNTKPIAADSTGAPLPQFRVSGYRLEDNEVFLISDYSPRSFDGRYFGPQKRDQIKAVVMPVFTWP